MAWLQLRVYSSTPDFAEEILLAHGAQAVSFVDAGDSPILEPGVGETPLWPNTITQGWFLDGQDLAPVLAALRDTLPEGTALNTETALIEDQDWVRVWLEHWPPMRFGERFWVCPREKLAEIGDPEAIVLQLDPGLAFGTGTHPTTALCLQWLAQADLRGKTVLDYGCGSGILGIAALLLGAEKAICVDIDPQALTATRDNAAVNGVAERVRTLLPADFDATVCDLLLANILANPLMQLAPLLAQCAAPGAPLVLAGLLQRHADEVRSAYASWFDFEEDQVQEGWTRLTGRCRMPALIAQRRIHERLITAGQPQRLHFPVLAKAGVKAIINLAMPSSPGYLADEREICEGLGMRYLAIPVPWDAPTREHYAQFCTALDALADRKTLVHCALNMRVSAFTYLWRSSHRGEDEAGARAEMQAIWQPNAVWANFIETIRQGAAVG